MLQSTKPLLSQWPLPQSNSGSEQGKPQSRAQRATPAELPGPALPGHLVIQQKLGLPWTTLSTKVLLLFSPLGLHTLLLAFDPPHRMLWWSWPVGLWLLIILVHKRLLHLWFTLVT